ncbi:M56 family metallopeptidase [Mucilaginibacter calamicampi]|uniref:M56 family metallopeptidase n=2 Tax=Mucilaginibacter calamicampi TaxID=1302352 RepID=A0ABW2YVD3_9SPHI
MSYILSVAAIIGISLLFYRMFLDRETFFRLNRLVLLSCLIMAFIVPLVHVPAKFSFRSAVPVALDNVVETPVITQPEKRLVMQPTEEVNYIKTVTPPSPITIGGVVAGAIKYIPFIYWGGIAIMGTNLLLQIFVLLYRSRKSRIVRDGVCRIVEVDDDRAPCSFGNNIYINPGKYDVKTYSKILAHEKIHVIQAHSVDLLLAEAMLIFQWFNPLAWIYRKDIERNLEYLTDDSVLKGNNFEPSDYQLSLLKVSVPHMALNITTNYSQSMLKKRILMMNARRSNINSMWKYMTLVLLMGVLVCNINQPLAAIAANNVPFSFNKNTDAKNADVAVHEQAPAALPPAASPSPENNNNEPVKIAGGLTPPPPALDADTSNRLKFSNTKGRIEIFYERGTYKMPFPDDIVVADAAFVNAISGLGYSSLSPSQMDSLKTAGVTPQFAKDIAALGYTDLPYKILCMLKLAGVTPEYIKSFSDLGYGHLMISKLISFKFSNIEAAYIKSMQRVGLTIPLELVTMAKLRNLTPEYVQGFKDLGYTNITYDRISMWKLQGIHADYIRGFNKIGYNNIPESEVSFLKISKLTPEYITAMKDKGVVYADLKRYTFGRDRN